MPSKAGGKAGGKASSSRKHHQKHESQQPKKGDGNRQTVPSSSSLVAKPTASPEEKPRPWTTPEELIRSLSLQWAKIAPQVQLLTLHCKPSPHLPLEFAAEFCHPPTIESIYHACNSPAFTGALARVMHIPLGTLVSIPPAKAKAHAAFASGMMGKTVHPAAGQFGLVAYATIPPRTFLGPYLGVVHTEQESDANSNYDLRIWAERKKMAAEDATTSADATSNPQGNPSQMQEDDEEEMEQIPLGVDATHAGGVLRFVNDYRGILIRPNVFFQDWSAPADPNYPPSEDGEAALLTAMPESPTSLDTPPPRIVRGIGMFTGADPVYAGTELCVSYGKGFWQARAEEESNDQVSDER